MSPKEALHQEGQGLIATPKMAIWALKNETTIKELTREMLVGASIHHDNDANRQKVSAYGEFVAHMENLIKEGRRLVKEGKNIINNQPEQTQ